MRELTPVILQSELKEALAAGSTLEIDCIEAANRQGNIWCGVWKVFVRHGSQRAVIVATRNLEPRVFKTITGLFSFAHEFGFKVVSVPLRKGERVEWHSDDQDEVDQ